MSLLLNAISYETARQRVKNWRLYARKKLGFGKTDVPKGIFIPMVDILNVRRAFQTYDNRKVSGIRIYFTKNSSMLENPDDLYLTCIVVPTVKTIKRDANGNEIHNDAIIKIPIAGRSSGKAAKTAAATNIGDGLVDTIYDMTHPCPPYCDGTTRWLED